MTSYQRAGGAEIPAQVINFYALWGAVRLGMMLTYSNWLTSTGQVSSIDYTSAAVRETHVVRKWLADDIERVLGDGAEAGS
jgi:hypothetical protein